MSAISYGSYDTTGSYELNQEDSMYNQHPTSYANTTASRRDQPHTPNTFVAVNQSSLSAMSSPATVPMDVQKKLKALEDKLAQYQGLEARVELFFCLSKSLL